MGFFANIANRIRTSWSKDKEQLAVQLAKGQTTSTSPQSGYDSLQSFGYDAMQDYLRLEHDLLSRYLDYEEMDEYPLTSTGLDIYADDATQLDSHHNHKIWVTSPDKEIEDNLNHLLHETLRADDELWSQTRMLAQYGNNYEEIIVTDEGVRGLNCLLPVTVRRIEGPKGELYGFIQDARGRFNFSVADFHQLLKSRLDGKPIVSSPSVATSNSEAREKDKVVAFEGWEVVHFRLQTKRRRSVYGFGVLEPVRWIWKRLILLEDSAMIYRLQRAQERFAFYVDVGDLPPQEALAWLNRVRQQFKKKKFINAQGKLDLKIDIIAPDEDLYIPVRKGTEGTRVEVLGSPNWQSVDDITYFLDKFFAGMKIPKAYLAQEEGSARAVLSQQDVRFARTILRLQGPIKEGYSKICRVHLSALGVDPQDTKFTVHMTVPSAIFELAQLEVRSARADLAARMGEFVSLPWILAKVFGLSDDEISLLLQEREEDKVRDFVTEARAQSAAVAEFPQYMQGAPASAFAPQQQPGMDQPGGGGGGDDDGNAPPPRPSGGDPNSPPGMGMPKGVEPGGQTPTSDNPPQTASKKSKKPSIYSWNAATPKRSSVSKALVEERERDKRLMEKITQLRSNDRKLDHKLSEMTLLLRELQHAAKKTRSRF